MLKLRISTSLFALCVVPFFQDSKNRAVSNTDVLSTGQSCQEATHGSTAGCATEGNGPGDQHLPDTENEAGCSGGIGEQYLGFVSSVKTRISTIARSCQISDASAPASTSATAVASSCAILGVSTVFTHDFSLVVVRCCRGCIRLHSTAATVLLRR